MASGPALHSGRVPLIPPVAVRPATARPTVVGRHPRPRLRGLPRAGAAGGARPARRPRRTSRCSWSTTPPPTTRVRSWRGSAGDGWATGRTRPTWARSGRSTAASRWPAASWCTCCTATTSCCPASTPRSRPRSPTPTSSPRCAAPTTSTPTTGDAHHPVLPPRHRRLAGRPGDAGRLEPGPRARHRGPALGVRAGRRLPHRPAARRGLGDVDAARRARTGGVRRRGARRLPPPRRFRRLGPGADRGERARARPGDRRSPRPRRPYAGAARSAGARSRTPSCSRPGRRCGCCAPESRVPPPGRAGRRCAASASWSAATCDGRRVTSRRPPGDGSSSTRRPLRPGPRPAP